MKKLLVAVAIATLALTVCSASFAASSYYGITNNDLYSGNNTATVCKYSGGTLNCNFMTLTATGQYGIGGGYFAAPRNTIASNAACVFVSNAYGDESTNYGSISTFSHATGYGLVGSYSDGFNLAGYYYGIGLALSPDNHYLYAAYSGTQNIATWTVNSDCSLTLGHEYADPVGDYPSPLAVSSDGSILVVPEPNYGYIDVFGISGGTTLSLLSSNYLYSLNSNCSSTGCYPTGVDLTKVSGGNVLMIAGNATLSGPYYVSGVISTSTGVLSSVQDNCMCSSGLQNLETPQFGHAAWATGSGTVFLGASGFGTGYPAGVAVGTLSGGNITYNSAYVNSNAYYGGNTAVATVSSNAAGVWQPIVDNSFNNNVYLYKVIGTTASALANASNAGGSGSYVLSIVAFPGR